MDWKGAALIVFACTAVNNLGLIGAVEQVIRHRLPIINCPKCLTFWSVLAYGLFAGENAITVVAAALFCAYTAIWLELLMGFTNRLYDRMYEQIYSTADTTSDDEASADSTLPELWLEYGNGKDSECTG